MNKTPNQLCYDIFRNSNTWENVVGFLTKNINNNSKLWVVSAILVSSNFTIGGLRWSKAGGNIELNLVVGNRYGQHLKQSFKDLRVDAQFARSAKQDVINFSLISPSSPC